MSSELTLTLLGTGSSGGVPRVGNQWGDCDPFEPRNRRRRCALLIERRSCVHGMGRDPGEHTQNRPGDTVRSGPRRGEARTTVVIDAGADLREQLLGAGVQSIEALVLTHAHADHIFGLDDLRQMALYLRRPIDVYLDAATRVQVMSAFGYCFHQPSGSHYPVFCTEVPLQPRHAFSIDGPGGPIDLNTLVAEHGDINALGIRVGDALYLPDAKRVTDPRSLDLLSGVRVLIVDALRHKPHPAHMSLEESLAFVESVGPECAILTNLHSDLDYATLKRTLPAGVEPGYDGLQIRLDPQEPGSSYMFG